MDVKEEGKRESKTYKDHSTQDKTFRGALHSSILLLTLAVVIFSLSLLTEKLGTLEHFLLISIAITAVHLLDRWWLFRGRTDAQPAGEATGILDQLKDDVQSGIESQASQFAEAFEHFESAQADTERKIEKLLAESANAQADTERKIEKLLAESSTSLGEMARSGIEKIYSSRAEASENMKRDLLDPRNTRIRLIGISLNDFLRSDQKGLAEAWNELRQYVLGKKPLRNRENKLDIRILLIDPGCIGAKLRAYGEVRGKDDLTIGRMAEDVTAVIEPLIALEEAAKKNATETGVTFECRMYRLPPILFLCHTDTVCYSQQYLFWSTRIQTTPMPVLRYRSDAESDYPVHKEKEAHFDWIWKKASIAVFRYARQSAVGVDKGIAQSGAANAYTDHDEALRRIIWLLENAQKRIWIQGISLHSYFKPGRLLKRILNIVKDGQVDIRVLLINRDSEQAMYRSYRELAFEVPLRDYMENKIYHRKAELYRDTDRSIENLSDRIKHIEEEARKNSPDWQPKIEVREYSTAPACFMLLVDDTVLTEQYHYGKVSDESGPLGKDMPLFEYSKSTSTFYKSAPLRNPYLLLEDHFKFAFEHSQRVPLDKKPSP